MSNQSLTGKTVLITGGARRVGAAVARYFRDKGWRRVAVATADDERAQQRRAGFIEAWGADVPVATVPAPSSLALGRRALAELLARKPRVQAVMASPLRSAPRMKRACCATSSA